MTSGLSEAHIYCTYFDHRYLARGVSMIQSLRRVGELGRVWILCLTSEASETLLSLQLTNVEVIGLTEFEEANPELSSLQDDRNLIEYFFTLTPFLVRHVMRSEPPSDWVTYLDADLWFFASPEPLYDELGSSSVGIIPHRYPDGQSWRLKFGTYNVGWVSFRLNEAGLECSDWWAARCAEWCHDRPEDGRFADQGYLDGFCSVVNDVHVIQHVGADLAPWNLRSHELATAPAGGLHVDGKALLFFHFHGIDRTSRRVYLKHAPYRVRTTRLIRERIYAPYLRVLDQIDSSLPPAGSPADVLTREKTVAAKFLSGRRFATRALARLRGDSIKIVH